MARVKSLTAKMDKIGEQIIDKENESLGENLGMVDKVANKISNLFGGKDVVNLDKDEEVQYQKWLKAVGKKRADELKKEYAHVYEKRRQDVQNLKDQLNPLADEIAKIQGLNTQHTSRLWQILAVFFHVIFYLEKNRVFFQ